MAVYITGKGQHALWRKTSIFCHKQLTYNRLSTCNSVQKTCNLVILALQWKYKHKNSSSFILIIVVLDAMHTFEIVYRNSRTVSILKILGFKTRADKGKRDSSKDGIKRKTMISATSTRSQNPIYRNWSVTMN